MEHAGLQTIFERKSLEWQQLALGAAKAGEYARALQHAEKAMLLLPNNDQVVQLVAALKQCVHGSHSSDSSGGSSSGNGSVDSTSCSNSSTHAGSDSGSGSSEFDNDTNSTPIFEGALRALPWAKQTGQHADQPNSIGLPVEDDHASLADAKRGRCRLLQARSSSSTLRTGQSASGDAQACCAEAEAERNTVMGMRMASLSSEQRDTIRALRLQIRVGLEKLQLQAEALEVGSAVQSK